MDAQQWVDALAARLGVAAPDRDAVDDLLSLAGTAAHTAERWVAPVSTWLVGSVGLDPAAARALVEQLAAEHRDGPDDPDAPPGPVPAR